MLAHRIPYPPSTGDKVRAYHVLRHLARRHAVTLACLGDERDPVPASALREVVADLLVENPPRAERLARSLWTLALGGSATVGYFHSPALHARLAGQAARAPFDVVYVSSSSMTPYARHGGGAPVVADFVDVDSDKWRQYASLLPAHRGWLYRLEAARLGREEARAARLAARCLVTTRVEAQLLTALAPGSAVAVVPNGVDLEYFRPADRNGPPPPVMIFTGAMDYLPNADAAVYFAERIFPRVREAVPAARFLVVGKNPARAVRRLAGRPGITVTGSVPDVRPFLHEAAVAVAPLRIARGVQNKVLEAMAAGLPVVTTSVAHRGLDAIPGRHLLVEDDPTRFAETVIRLLATPALRAALGEAARRFVERHHSWTATATAVEGIVEAAAGRAAAPAVCAPGVGADALAQEPDPERGVRA
ncbi:MAG TPA: TIGR03087 family PEP-CTERM/XrtA system glycosyltransferase [Candidatus Binatia bacterium]|nr:TIGR03087 family PEP-CTERM/XrtA system glycosyltransferase [Candidatus Binatia bacterium]